MFEFGSDRWPGIAKLVEECGEVIQVCGKLMMTKGEILHWNVSHLGTVLENELGDLQAAIAFVIARCNLDIRAIERLAAEKLARFEKWHEEKISERIRSGGGL